MKHADAPPVSGAKENVMDNEMIVAVFAAAEVDDDGTRAFSTCPQPFGPVVKMTPMYLRVSSADVPYWTYTDSNGGWADAYLFEEITADNRERWETTPGYGEWYTSTFRDF